MLVSFKIKNFKSYKDLKKFSMETTKLKNLQDTNTFAINDNISLLKSAVIYGANASGKSSLLSAMNNMKQIIKNSMNIETIKRYPKQTFLLNTKTEDAPNIFEIEFIIGDKIYHYSFAIYFKGKIKTEWLKQKKIAPRARWIELFKREEQNIKIHDQFEEGLNLEAKTRENALFLSVVAQFNGQISLEILKWFNQFNILSNIESDEFKHESFDMLKNKEHKDKIVNFIKSADIGISDIKIKKNTFNDLNLNNSSLKDLPDFFLDELKENGFTTINTEHIQYNEDNSFSQFKLFDLDLESDGTQKLLALSGPIIKALTKGEVLIVDELDNSLHTELLKAIVMLFNSKETNPNNAQLIFTTHDTNLLNQKFFRRDQIWFTEKDIYGATDLYSLVEYGKGKTRDDLELAKNYLKGKFGAIPHIALDYEVQ